MTFARTLMIYVARRFATMTVAMLAALAGLVALFDLIELLRRAATRQDATFALVGQIAALRLPFVAMQILPFAILLGGIIAFWRLTRSSELVVARAAGVSAWGFLAGPVAVAVLLGAVATAAISPLSSAMLARAERLDSQFLRNTSGISALAGGRLWLRQADAGIDPRGVAILSGRPVALRDLRAGEAFRLDDVSVWRLSAEDRPLARVEAPSAVLAQGRWIIPDAVVFGADRMPAPAQRLEFPTDLTPARIQDSFASPDTLSFWALPDFIQVLENAGFSAVRHRLHFQSLLALPLLAAAMALLAAGFSMRSSRRGGVAQMIGGGVAAGFALFVVDKITGEFGEAGTLPVIFAAWAPAGAGFLLATALLLHLEDG
ncbi:LPS export ABC transporter permease LptG [Roseomonas sp. CECT 9278]|uniref:LPS export ABC transporter permease LptG n=1 Tax=Roseomonas sp. CECT 9278 TaxID=2845823 RepID=UPI001E2ADA80|nr:LPS export ABC transporter permease LptG [Roseomonas sp. CECT 9278]CAH0252052.1 Lipopolysaccharide export system permease protein LptG [Roseomonas sp. CECT 9278]